MLFKHPSTGHVVAEWHAAFAQYFPSAKYAAVGWDSTDNISDTSALIAAGFELDSNIVMTATAVHAPPKTNAECTICPLTNWGEWMTPEHAINAAQPASVREGADYA